MGSARNYQQVRGVPHEEPDQPDLDQAPLN